MLHDLVEKITDAETLQAYNRAVKELADSLRAAGEPDKAQKLTEIADGVRVAVIHESPFRITELTEVIAEILPEAMLTVCCDLTKLHEKTLYGKPAEVLSALKSNDKTEKGEYCVVMDLHSIHPRTKEEPAAALSTEARLIETMKEGKTLRQAQDLLILQGEKKNAVKQAALLLKKMFTNE